MLRYQVECIASVIDEIKPIFEEHYKEIGHDVDNLKLNVDYDMYNKLESIGLLHIVTVRDESLLVGYFISILSPLIHFKHVMNAHNDAIFIHKEYRKSTAGYRLIKFALKELKEFGADRVTLHSKTVQPFDRLCEGLGMTKIETIYTKDLGV